MAENEKPDDNIVELDGHLIDTDKNPLDHFFDGATGKKISDADWDEQKRRLEADPVPDDEIIFDDFPEEASE